MSFTRLLAIIGVVIMAILPASGAMTSQISDTDCDDIAAYIDMVDAEVAEEMHALVTTPGWEEDAQGAIEAMNAGDAEIDHLSVPMMQPLLDFLAIPGEVLAGIDPKDVPASALPLHDSATVYWVTNSEVYVALLEDPDTISYANVEVLEEAMTDNIAAQDAITEQCPEIPESYTDDQARLETLFAVLDRDGDPGLLADATLADLEGTGFFFLFFGEEEIEAKNVTVGSTPVTMEPQPATPED